MIVTHEHNEDGTVSRVEIVIEVDGIKKRYHIHQGAMGLKVTLSTGNQQHPVPSQMLVAPNSWSTVSLV